MKIIKNKEKIIAIIYRNSDWIEGLNFITPSNLFLQVGLWWYQKGKKLDPHTHKSYDRSTNRTHELTYVRKGSMKVIIFDEYKKYLQEFVLNEGDLAVYVCGGHGYEILEDNTKIIEVKNGPFIGVNDDKEKF